MPYWNHAQEWTVLMSAHIRNSLSSEDPFNAPYNQNVVFRSFYLTLSKKHVMQRWNLKLTYCYSSPELELMANGFALLCDLSNPPMQGKEKLFSPSINNLSSVFIPKKLRGEVDLATPQPSFFAFKIAVFWQSFFAANYVTPRYFAWTIIIKLDSVCRLFLAFRKQISHFEKPLFQGCFDFHTTRWT